MEIFHSFQEITGFTGAVVALGTFDGVHRGHQMVMKTAIKRAAACGVKTMVVTFTAHPLSVLCPDKEPLRLATIGQKAEYIEAVCIDGLVLLPTPLAGIAGRVLPEPVDLYPSVGYRRRFEFHLWCQGGWQYGDHEVLHEPV